MYQKIAVFFFFFKELSIVFVYLILISTNYSLTAYLYRFIPTKKNKRRYNIDNEIKAILREMISKKEQAMQDGQLENNDLLGLLLQCKEESNKGMTTEDIIEECKLFYFAGQETTATLLTWTMILLSMHPDWQEKARDEVLRVCGKKTLDFEAINHLKIVSSFLNMPKCLLLLSHNLKLIIFLVLN